MGVLFSISSLVSRDYFSSFLVLPPLNPGIEFVSIFFVLIQENLLSFSKFPARFFGSLFPTSKLSSKTSFLDCLSIKMVTPGFFFNFLNQKVQKIKFLSNTNINLLSIILSFVQFFLMSLQFYSLIFFSYQIYFTYTMYKLFFSSSLLLLDF